MWPVVGSVIHDYGLVVALLVATLVGFSVFCWLLFKWLGPFMERQLDQANARLDASTRVFEDALKRRDAEFEKLGDRIAARLDRQDEHTEKVRERFGDQLGRIEDEVKRRKR